LEVLSNNIPPKKRDILHSITHLEIGSLSYIMPPKKEGLLHSKPPQKNEGVLLSESHNKKERHASPKK